MQILGHEPSFWIAIAGATLFKLVSSQHHSLRRATVTVGAAVFAAWVFTEPFLGLMGWDEDTYKAPAAALIALSGESVMRGVMTLDLHKLIALIRGPRP